MTTSIDIVVPDLGDFENVEVIEVLVKAGDSVEREEGLITVETDKASMDIPAADNGVVQKLTVSVGDKVSSGDVIGTLVVPASEAVASAAAVSKPISGETTVLATEVMHLSSRPGNKHWQYRTLVILTPLK